MMNGVTALLTLARSCCSQVYCTHHQAGQLRQHANQKAVPVSFMLAASNIHDPICATALPNVKVTRQLSMAEALYFG